VDPHYYHYQELVAVVEVQKTTNLTWEEVEEEVHKEVVDWRRCFDFDQEMVVVAEGVDLKLLEENREEEVEVVVEQLLYPFC
jgi:hypothetical protein